MGNPITFDIDELDKELREKHQTPAFDIDELSRELNEPTQFSTGIEPTKVENPYPTFSEKLSGSMLGTTPKDIASTLPQHKAMQDVEEGQKRAFETKFTTDPEYRANWFQENTGMSEEDFKAASAKVFAERFNNLIPRAENIFKKNIEDNAKQRGGTGIIRTIENLSSSMGAKSKLDELRGLSASFKNNNLWSGMYEGADLLDVMSGGLADFASEKAYHEALKKQANGEELSEEEQFAIDASDLYDDINETFELLGGRSGWNKAGKAVGQSAEFSVGMLPTSGLGFATGLMKNVGLKAGWKAVKNAANNGVRAALSESLKQGGKVIGRSLYNTGLTYAESILRAVFMPSTYGRYWELRNEHLKNGESLEGNWLQDAGRAGIEMTHELASEIWGSTIIHDSFRAMGKALGVDKAMDAIGFGRRKRTIFGWTPTAAQREAMRNLGYSGDWFSEVASEAAGDVATNLAMEVFFDDAKWGDMATKEYWTTLLGATAMQGIAFTSANMLTNIPEYHRLNNSQKKRDNALSNIKSEDLRKAVEIALTHDSAEDMGTALSQIDWNAYDKVDVANAMDAVRLEVPLRIATSEREESERIAKFAPLLEATMAQAYQGADAANPAPQPIYVEAKTEDGASVRIVSGDYTNPDAMLNVEDISTGETFPIIASKVSDVKELSLENKIAESYKLMFSTEENVQRLSKVMESLGRLAYYGKVTSADAEDIIKRAGYVVFSEGQIATLVNGEQVEIASPIMADGHYLVRDNNGNTSIVSLLDIVQPNVEVAEAQIKMASREERGTTAEATSAMGQSMNASMPQSPMPEGVTAGEVWVTPQGIGRVLEYNPETGKVYVDINLSSDTLNKEEDEELVEVDAAELTRKPSEAEMAEARARSVRRNALRIVDETSDAVGAIQEVEEVAQPVEQAAEVIEQAPQEVPSMENVPTTADGAVDYESITDANLYAKLLTQDLGSKEEALEVVNTSIEAYEAEIADMQSKKEKSTTKAVAKNKQIKAMQQQLDVLNQVRDILTPQETEAEQIAETPQVEPTEETQQEVIGLVQDDFTATLPNGEAELIDSLARSLGLSVEFVDKVNKGNSNAQILGNKVLIAKKNRDKAIKFLVGHEFTHRMQDLSPEAYAEFKAAVKEYMGEEVYNTLLQKEIAKYREHNIYRTQEQLEDEIIADFAGSLAFEADVLDTFIAAHADKKSMWQAILDVLRAIREWILEDTAYDTAEARALQNTIGKLEALFQSASEKVAEGAIEEVQYSDAQYSLKETDPATLEALNNGEKIKVYRGMQVIDGKLYPPMSAKVDGKMREPIELGVWERAEERPDLADAKGYFKLDKGNKTSLKARYNPYIHTSLTPLNDQFSSAQDRPNLVTVEVEIPASELTSGYKADKAKDAVGKVEWKAGVVQSQLSGTRTVILSRWDRPLRIVPDSEVAQRIVEMFGDKKVVMPSNVVTPSLRAELEELGVSFKETDNQGKERYSLSSSNKSVAIYDKANGTNVKDFFEFLRNGKVFEKGKPNLFHIANAGTLLQNYGIKGKFMVGEFTYSKAHTQDEAHNLGVKEWVDVINTINEPLAIASYKGRDHEYRIYTYATINGENICVGVNVSLKDNEIELSNIISAYGRDINKLLGAERVYLIYPESIDKLKQRISQVSTEPNSPLNATSSASANKDTTSSPNMQEVEPRNSLKDLDAPYFDAVARGDTGNIIPLSERFNPEKEDIRYSAKDIPSLVGVHNISLEKLRKVIKMGGLANPSVAVIDADKQTHEGYGEYSLILPKNMVDARQGKNAGTWAGDAWTPTYPQITKRMSKDKDISRYYKDIDVLPEAMRNRVRLDFDSFMNGRSANALAYWYLFDKGVAPELVDVPARYPVEIVDALNEATNGSFSMFGLSAEERARCLDAFVAYRYKGDRATYDADMAARKERLENFAKNHDKGIVRKKAQEDLDAINEYGFDYDEVSRFIRDVEWDVRHKGETDVDATIKASMDYIAENNLGAEYDAWRNSLDERYGIEEYIFDGYTNSGTPRYLPHTVENASKWMKKQGRQGAVATFPSFGTFVAVSIPKMTTLESIRKRKNLLGKSKEEYDAFREKWENVYFELGKKLQPDAKGFDDYGYWRLIEAVGQKNPKEYIKKQYNIELSAEDVNTLNEMLNAIRTEYPARYFETKFERPLQLNDFVAAVVPDDVPMDVWGRLNDAKVKIFEYEKGNSNSRTEAMQKATATEGVRFSVKDTFYSNAENAVRLIKQEKATPEQWLKMIEKNGGLKAGEDKWLGLSDWLKASDKKTLTKDEVLDYIHQNQIQIEEVEYEEYAEEAVEEQYRAMEDKLQEMFNNYITEYYEENSDSDEYGDYATDYAIVKLREELGDTFPYTIEISGNSPYFTFSNEDDTEMRKWSEKLGLPYTPSNQINFTRLGYTTDGLDNKREIALTVPTIEPWNTNDEIHFGDAGKGRAVAWIRFGETTDIEGKRVLVIDEIQSKRHQEGREKGYRDVEAEKREKAERERELTEVVLPRLAELNQLYNEKYGVGKWRDTEYDRQWRPRRVYRFLTPEEQAEHESLSIRATELQTTMPRRYGIPSAPFEKNWAELAMKRMLRYAAENGYDKVAWTTGEQQADRYNLGAVMQGLKAYKTSPNTYYVIPYNNGAIGEFVKEYNEKELAETFGKEIAANIIKNTENATEETPYEMTGDDLRIGGSGMKAFYDQMLPSFVRKYAKKWGATVGEVTMPSLEENNTMHSVDVTPAMRESVMQGQPLFHLKDNVEEAQDVRMTPAEIRAHMFENITRHHEREVNRINRLYDAELRKAERISKQQRMQNGEYPRNAKYTVRLQFLMPQGKTAYPLEWQVVHDIANGLKVKWNDSKDGKKRGLSTELGLGSSRREKYGAITTGAQMYVEDYVAQLVEENDGYARGIDDNDVRSIVLDALSQYTRPKEALDALEQQFLVIEEDAKLQEPIDYIERARAKALQEEDEKYEAQKTSYEKNPRKFERDYFSRMEKDLRWLNFKEREIRVMREKIQRIRADYRSGREVRNQYLAEVKADIEKFLNNMYGRNISTSEVRFIMNALKKATSVENVTYILNRIATMDYYGTQRIEQERKARLLKMKLSFFIPAENQSVEQYLEQEKISRADAAAFISRFESSNVGDDMTVFRAAFKDRYKGVDSKGVTVAKLIDAETAEIMAFISKHAYDEVNLESLEKEKEALHTEAEKLKSDLPFSDSAMDKIDQAQKIIISYWSAIAEREELKKSKEDLNDVEARITEAWKNGDHDLVSQLRGEKDAILKDRASRMPSINAHLIEANDAVERLLLNGKRLLSEEREAQRQHEIEVLNDVVNDITNFGEDYNELMAKANDHRKQTSEERKSKRKMVIHEWTDSLNHLLTLLAPYADGGRGLTYTRFMTAINKAVADTCDNVDIVNAQIAEAVDAIFGKQFQYKNLAQIMRRASAISLAEDVTLGYKAVGKERIPRKWHLRMDNALYLLAMWGQAEGRIKLEANGVTEADIAMVEDLIIKKDRRYLDFMNWVIRELLPSRREGRYNEVFRKVTGRWMPYVENYFPIHILSNSRHTEEKVSEAAGDKKSISPSAIKARIYNTNMVDLNVGFFEALMDNLTTMETWASMAEIEKDMNTILSNNRTKDLMNARLGENFSDRLKTAMQVTLGTLTSGKLGVTERWALNASRLWGATKIGYRINTALKQLSGAGALFAYTGNPIFIGYVLKNLAPTDAAEMFPILEKRWKEGLLGNAGLMDLSRGGDLHVKDWLDRSSEVYGNVTSTITKLGMYPNKIVDFYVSAVFAKSVYQFELNRYKKMGYSEEQAKEKALMDAEDSYNKTQQSSEMAYLSSGQINPNIVYRGLNVFMNNSIANYRLGLSGFEDVARAFSRFSKAQRYYRKEAEKRLYEKHIAEGKSEEEAMKMAKEESQDYKGTSRMGYFARGILKTVWGWWGSNFLFNYLSILPYMWFGDDDEKKREMTSDLWWSALFSPIALIPWGKILYDSVVVAYNNYNDRSIASSVLPMLEGVEDLIEDVVDIHRALREDDDLSNAQIYNTFNTLSTMMVGVDMNTFVNIGDGIADIANGDWMEGTLDILNVPNSQVKLLVGDRKADETWEEYMTRILRVRSLLDKNKVEAAEAAKYNPTTQEWEPEPSITEAQKRDITKMYKQYENAYQQDVLKKHRPNMEWSDTEKRYEEVVKEIGWSPNENPGNKKPKVEISTEDLNTLRYLQGHNAAMNKLKARFVGSDEEYAKYLDMIYQDRKQLIQLYDDNVK